MNDPAVSIALIVVAIIVAIGLVLGLLMLAFRGAANLFVMAAEQGFIGLAVYFACWIAGFPVMLVVCIILGFLSPDIWMRREIRQKKRQIKSRNAGGYDTTEQEQELAEMEQFIGKN